MNKIKLDVHQFSTYRRETELKNEKKYYKNFDSLIKTEFIVSATRTRRYVKIPLCLSAPVQKNLIK